MEGFERSSSELRATFLVGRERGSEVTGGGRVYSLDLRGRHRRLCRRWMD